MAEVFISYSRKDKEFVRRLGDALVAHQREAWVDWKDIPLTAEWQQEIFNNIDAADNFVFIISPDSVASRNCKKEIDHAVANNKRMVPIFYRAVSDGDIPETLGRFQRIDFDDENGFEAKFAALIKSLDTDLVWTRAHTRLLTRAKEWEREGKDRSFLLRGKDLGEAEQMVAKTADREPKPTTLQSQYILASRQSATKTQRIISGGVATALVVAIGLAIYAFIQKNLAQKETQIAEDKTRIADANAKEAKLQQGIAENETGIANANADEANRQKEKALLQARITNARRLATESQYRFGNNASDLAISGALAVESLQAYPTTEGMKVLLQVLRLIPAAPRILANAHSGAVAALAFSRDGRWMASGGTDGQVLLWDLSDRLNRRALEQQLPFNSPAGAMDFSPDGRWLAAACAEGGSNAAVCIWDTSTGKPAQSPLPHGYILHSIAFAPDGQYLATSTFGTGPERGIRVFRRAGERWEEAQGTPAGDGAFVSLAFAKNGVLAVADDSGLWLTQPGASPSAATYKFTDGGSCSALSFSAQADVQILAGLCQQGVAIGSYSQSAYNLKLTKVPLSRTSDPHLTRMSLATNGDFVAIGNVVFSAGDGSVRLLLTARDSAVRSIGYPPDGSVVIGGLEDGSIALWPTTQGNFAIRLSDHPGTVTGVSVSPDERLLAVVTKDGNLLLYDISDYRRIRRLQTLKVGTDPKAVLFSPNGRFIAVAAKDSVRLLHTSNLGTVASSKLSGELQTTFTFNSQELVTMDSSGIHRIDTESGKQIGRIITGGFRGFALSPDGQCLAAYSQYNVGGQHHYIRSSRVWKLSNGAEVAWEEQGRQRSDGPATRPSQGGPQRLVKAAAGWSTPAQFRSLSPDGVWRVELTQNSATLVLEEADANRPIASLEHDGTVIDAAFSPKGRWLASSSKDGTVRLWPMKNDDLTTQACRMLPRNLTPAEWEEFSMDGPYRKTCPNLP